MSTLTPGWYSTNSNRAYPLSDTATLVADDGKLLPNNLLADISIAVPGETDSKVFVSAATVTPGLLTLILSIDSSPATAVAAVTVPNRGSDYRQEVLLPLLPGVQGWVVFGEQAGSQYYSCRFSTPEQSQILSRCVRFYRRTNLAGVGKVLGQQLLTGLIPLRPASGISITRRCLDLDLPDNGNCVGGREVVFFELTAALPDELGTILQTYAGDCGKRPESRTCPDPQPLESISGVGPNCDGEIFIEFRGCADITQISQEVIDGESQPSTGVVLDCISSLSTACVSEPQIPDETGRLPNEYDDLCEGEYDESVILPVDICSGIVSPYVVDTVDQALYDEPGAASFLPSVSAVTTNANFPLAFPSIRPWDITQVAGAYDLNSVGGGRFELLPTNNRNVALSNYYFNNNFYRGGRVDARFANNSRSNFQLIYHWGTRSGSAPLSAGSYQFIGVDFRNVDNNGTLELGEFDGLNFNVKTEVSFVADPSSSVFSIIGRWYRHPTITTAGWVYGSVFQRIGSFWFRLAEIDSLLFCNPRFIVSANAVGSRPQSTAIITGFGFGRSSALPPGSTFPA